MPEGGAGLIVMWPLWLAITWMENFQSQAANRNFALAAGNCASQHNSIGAIARKYEGARLQGPAAERLHICVHSAQRGKWSGPNDRLLWAARSFLVNKPFIPKSYNSLLWENRPTIPKLQFQISSCMFIFSPNKMASWAKMADRCALYRPHTVPLLHFWKLTSFQINKVKEIYWQEWHDLNLQLQSSALFISWIICNAPGSIYSSAPRVSQQIPAFVTLW